MMQTTVELTEAEAQFLRDLLLKQIRILSNRIGEKQAEKYLKGMDKAYAYNMLQQTDVAS